MSEATTSTTTTTQATTVTLQSRVAAAVLDTTTGKVKLAENVSAKIVEPLLEDLIREIQVLQQQVQQLKGAQTEQAEKL